MFVMYCVYGESCSSLFIESTDSMIYVQCVISDTCAYQISRDKNSKDVVIWQGVIQNKDIK